MRTGSEARQEKEDGAPHATDIGIDMSDRGIRRKIKRKDCINWKDIFPIE
jgi:hypothetical protein